jgi:diguanylate cyclase (GGDEF)-like protein
MELEAKLLRLLQERRLRREVEREKMRILEYVRDVEAAHEAKEAAENKYRSLFEHSLNGMALLADDGLFVEDGNQAFWTMLGNDGELDGGARLSLLGLIPDEASRQRLLHGVALVRSNGRGTLADLPLQLHGNGVGRFDLGLSEVRIGGQSQLLASFKDVTHQQALSAQLAEMAHTDALTGLLNKRSFAPRLEEALFDADEERRPVTLLALDLDNFKQVNDRFGHQRGDDLLRMTGEVILGSIRNGSDSAFRCGGDEFFVLLAGSHGEAGRVVADRIRGAFSRRDTAGTTLSIGLAEWHAGMSAGEFMGEADRALYAAKAAGKDSVSLA